MTAVHQLHPDPEPESSSEDSTPRGQLQTIAWRGDRPAEDPEKTKPWGFVTAKPSEYLIHVRRGKIRRRTTGQGGSCFKWPWDSVAIVPTTINRLQFRADQVTREKVGVDVAGLAVYRIVEPEIAFRMLNFSYGERASAKLEEVLREMFVGATRRLVANLTVEEVMTRRKSAIATELMGELAPVLDGSGRTDDSTACGWGVVLDTVEVQNVRVLSDRVFSDMQAGFRSELATRAREAELDSAKAIETFEAKIERDRIARDQARQLAAMEAEAHLQAERARRQEASAIDKLARDRRLAEAEAELAVLRHEHALAEHERAEAMAVAELQARADRRETESLARAVITRRELELRKLSGEVDNVLAEDRKRVENLVSEDRIKLAVVQEALPAVAEALKPEIGELRVTQLGGGGEALDPTAMVVRGITQLVDLGRAFGLAAPTQSEGE